MAVDVIRSLGFSIIEARTSSTAAKAYLESVIDGKEPLPDVMIVDLDLGYESGFELLRFRHGHPELSSMRLIVWTVLGEQQQQICRLFNVDCVVPKADGVLALKRALEPLAVTAS
jgi:hypothetical protein